MKIIDSTKGRDSGCEKEETTREFATEVEKNIYEKNRITKETIKKKIAEVESISLTVEQSETHALLDHLIDLSHTYIHCEGDSYCRSYARAIIAKYSRQLAILKKHHPDDERMGYYEMQLRELKLKAVVKRNLILIVCLFIAGISALYVIFAEIFK